LSSNKKTQQEPEAVIKDLGEETPETDLIPEGRRCGGLQGSRPGLAPDHKEPKQKRFKPGDDCGIAVIGEGR
jgi:hypothetical protein|tara:strand:+ start:58787 stop:59002 length:216 start_codon:yes stop_codon:yes gene_type:complete